MKDPLQVPHKEDSFSQSPQEALQWVSSKKLKVDSSALGVPLNQLRLVQTEDADIPLTLLSIERDREDPTKALLTVKEELNPRASYLFINDQSSALIGQMAPSAVGIALSAALGAALISNYVFTKYLGLCVFFGTSKRRDTAIGMGLTFTVVAILSATISWLLHQWVLLPLKIGFLQIIAFIGIVAFLVQASDTILRKIQPTLHSKFGIYIVLITTNCIILAVPLLNASGHVGFIEALGHAVGAGLGFALALFLMSCSRERAEIAPIPEIFKGLPIAFILAGLFALSFLGFSGLRIF